MPLTSQPIVSLLNGVSQQPASLRHPSQCEAQVNCLSSLSVGLEKRPPSQHVAKIVTSPLPSEGYFWHTINRSSTEQYLVAIENGDVRVFDLSDGSEQTVNYAENRFFTLNDSTAADTGLDRRLYVPPGVTSADFATSGISGDTVVWEQSSTGAFSGEETTVRTDTADTDAAVTITSGYWYRARVSAYSAGTIDAWIDWGDVSYLVSTDPKNDFRAVTIQDYTFITNGTITVSMDNDAGATNGESITATVQTFGDLPSTMPGANKIYKVEGDLLSEADTYYVKVDSSNTVYEEYFKPGDIDGFDQATMPHTLVDNKDGTFTYANGAWDSREVGDNDKTNKNPPFVGKQISEVFFFRNRFGVCAGEAVSLTRIGTANGGYFNFWRESIPTNLDTDSIHLESPHERNSKIHSAVAFDESMVLYTAEAQFVLNSDGALTPSTASIDVTTEFTAAGEARPVGLGQNVYFPVDGGDNVGVREYYVEADTSTNDATNVTAHVPRFIPQTPFKMAGATNEDLLAILTTGNQQRLYIYKFFWDGDTKAQSSWSYWEFQSDDVLIDVTFIGPTLYLAFERNDEVFMEKILLNDDAAQDDIGVKVHLDRRQSLTGVYDSTANITTWTPAAAVPSDATPSVVTGSGFTTAGESPALTVGSFITAAEDETNYDSSPTTEGSFSGGTGHAASDVITLSNGATITVDAVSAGVVTQFTVTTAGTAKGVAAGTALTQLSTTGSGTGFTLTPNGDNITSARSVYYASGDWSAAACWAGLQYEQSYQFSEQFVRSDGQTPDLTGRLQLRKMNVRYVNSGYFTAEVAPRARSTQTYTFTGNVLGAAEFTLGDISLYTGTFTFPIIGRSSLVDITLKNDSWKPATWLSAEWIGQHSTQPVIP